MDNSEPLTISVQPAKPSPEPPLLPETSTPLRKSKGETTQQQILHKFYAPLNFKRVNVTPHNSIDTTTSKPIHKRKLLAKRIPESSQQKKARQQVTCCPRCVFEIRHLKAIQGFTSGEQKMNLIDLTTEEDEEKEEEEPHVTAAEIATANTTTEADQKPAATTTTPPVTMIVTFAQPTAQAKSLAVASATPANLTLAPTQDLSITNAVSFDPRNGKSIGGAPPK